MNAQPYAGSGPKLARLFGMCLATLFIVALLSLRSQWLVLLGQQGLAPAQTFLRGLSRDPHRFLQAPTLFWLNASDMALACGLWAGLFCAAMSFVGLWPRLGFLFCAVIYLSFVSVGAPFFSFQWDNLLIETAFLAVFLPTHRYAPKRHLLFRLLLLKLYVESGLAKWQSPLGDWRSGLALETYFQTAPLPTFVAWYAHHLPPAILHALCYATLLMELCVPWLMFAGRRLRLLAAGLLTIFQLCNALTANYGFFVFLAVALHLFLLDESDVFAIEQDVSRLSRSIGRSFGRALRPWRIQVDVYRAGAVAFWLRLTQPLVRRLQQLESLGFIWFCVLWTYVSLADGLLHFGPAVNLSPPLHGVMQSMHSINTYRLFGAITTQRIEPELQVDGGEGFVAAHLWHKPGNLARAPDFVAPHQPRLDFQLWFLGLRPQVTPPYMLRLAEKLCDDPRAVWPLLRPGLPQSIRRIRVVFWRYAYTTPAQKSTSGDWWQRTEVPGRLNFTCQQSRPLINQADSEPASDSKYRDPS